mmetsp:Transcript_80355/g.236402  ORF Transcript_80355/g.236402 Transcript_80355/m.236402 type:complete len:397 (+) Transcript_80355:113-1303(+)
MGQDYSCCSSCGHKDLDIHEPRPQVVDDEPDGLRLPAAALKPSVVPGSQKCIEGGEPGRPTTFSVVLHHANITRSVATVGWMDPYAVINVDEKEVGRTKPARWAHKEPKWESSFSWSSEGIPGFLKVSIWDKNNFHEDKLCGSVAIPCSLDMGVLERKEFALTKKNKQRGFVVLTISVHAAGGTAGAEQPALPRAPSLGAELDNVVSWSQSRDEGSPRIRLAEDAQQSLGSCDRSTELPETSDSAADRAVPAGDGRLAPSLMGSWKCIATTGLDEFLKATGVGMFQRKLAKAAKWPSWEFSVQDDLVVFINHSAIGDLKEEFPLGKEYSWKDGHGNLMTCIAEWQATANGGLLLTSRKGAIGSYTEERRVTGNLLEFTLTHGTGVSWGRTFQRSDS